jgi:hypothetical protein
MVGCARPTCSGVATIALGYDAIRRIAWFGELEDVTAGEATVLLCERHARSVKLPVGWIGRDERTDEPALWLPTDEPVHAAPAAPSEATARARHRTTAPPPETGTEADVLPLWVRERRDPAAHMAAALYGDEPHADQTVEEPSGPLMARAFRAAGLG